MKLTWFQGLSKVCGKYGSPTNENYDSSVAVRKSGCTDKELMQQLTETFYLLLYHNFQSVAVRNDTGKFIFFPDCKIEFARAIAYKLNFAYSDRLKFRSYFEIYTYDE